MAISEVTKQVVARERARLSTTIAEINREIDDLQAKIEALRLRKQELKAEADALTADIPEPTAAEIPLEE